MPRQCCRLGRPITDLVLRQILLPALRLDQSFSYPPEPTTAIPLSPAKVAIMAARYEARQDLFHPDDAPMPAGLVFEFIRVSNSQELRLFRIFDADGGILEECEYRPQRPVTARPAYLAKRFTPEFRAKEAARKRASRNKGRQIA